MRAGLPKKMLAFAGLLGPPVLWAAHFGLLYWAVSLELTLAPDAAVSRLLAVVLTLAALSGIILLAVNAGRFSPHEEGTELYPFWRGAIRWSAVVAGAGVIYDAMPLLMVPA